jgi:C-terminal processing protease CtpA/Prc
VPERFIAVFSETTRVRRRDRYAFWGEKDSLAVVCCQAPEEPVQEVVVPRSVPFTTAGLGERVTFRMIDRIGYIRVPILTNAGQRRDDTIEKQVEDALLQLRDAAAIILDIRGNPGGASWTAGAVASHFLTQPEKFGAFRFRDGAVRPCLQKARSDAFTGPLAILVDEGIGSASEIALLFPLVALRDPARTWTIGRPSAGGSGIPNFRFSYHGIYAQFPGIPFVDREGNLDLELTGITPNYPVTITVEDLLTGRDPDLAKAVEVLEAALASLEGE